MVTRAHNAHAAEPVEVYASRVVVRIEEGGRVPFDMFRYDSCVPDTEEDSRKLGRIADGTAASDDYTVTLRRYAPNANPPTNERWRGFGGKVVSWEYLP